MNGSISPERILSFATARKTIKQPAAATLRVKFSHDVKDALTQITQSLDHQLPFPARLAAIKLLEGDATRGALARECTPLAVTRADPTHQVNFRNLVM